MCIRDRSGFEAGTSAKRLVRTLLERASASRHGFDDMHLIRGSVDFSGLMDAYRQCLGASAKAADVSYTHLGDGDGDGRQEPIEEKAHGRPFG